MELQDSASLLSKADYSPKLVTESSNFVQTKFIRRPYLDMVLRFLKPGASTLPLSYPALRFDKVVKKALNCLMFVLMYTGIEAEAVMLGQAISMLLPEVIGYKLTGKLNQYATSTDLVLTITKVRNYLQHLIPCIL